MGARPRLRRWAVGLLAGDGDAGATATGVAPAAGSGHGGGIGGHIRPPGRGDSAGRASPRPGASSASAAGRRTRGDWRGSYGAEGYVLFAWHSFNVDVASLPGYASGYELRHVGDKPDPRIHVEISEADVLDTPLLYALPFSPLLGNAWLLAADVAQLLLPARATSPWPCWPVLRGRGSACPHRRRSRWKYGLGLDFWPTLLYTNYASHPSVLDGMWAVLLGVEALAMAGAGLARGLAPASAGRRRAP